MNAISLLSRLAASACLLLLAACQTPTTNTAQPDTQAGTAAAPQTTTPSQEQETQAAGQDEEQGIPVAVLLADTVQHEGWVSVPLNEGSMLYLNPEPIVTRNDLTGVQAGSSRDGEGLLALELSQQASEHVKRVTTDNPKRRLALIVGRTLMAAPGYAEPVSTEQLVFAVGTEQNATAAARAIAGVPQEGDAPSTPPQQQPQPQPSQQPQP
ncbi:SecDF P1 head subdomain-containing protein [Paracandidimonas soli]|uniref:SecDF P1 head subdomain domain-containing protein n=1 Tax=Paracandidimonas soli TaxID=1917182 RepID=A0A4R3VE03_9BURK|nr:hypothetical protein [Paracandidimonas soli]TCV01914.1 hypothetical protein EV686_102629 [Paracandidimonas soli]